MNRALDFEIGYPVNLANLSQAARQTGWDVAFLDMTLEEKEGLDSFALLEASLSDPALRLVGISNHTVRTSVTTRTVARASKRLRPHVPVVVGGVNATFMAEELLQSCEAIDFVLRGYAQRGLQMLLKRLEHGSEETVSGLTERAEGRIASHAIAPVTESESYFPLSCGLEIERYLRWSTVYSLLTHTGCTFSCNFCTSVMPGPYQNREVHRSAASVVAEMSAAIAHGFDSFFMSANIFTSQRARILELCEAMIEAGVHERATWVCMTRVEMVDPELLGRMRGAGCDNIAFGVESAGREQWLALRKGGYSEQRVAQAFAMTRAAGIATTAYLMLGAPEQTVDAVGATIGLVRRLNPDYRVVSFFQPFPGTPYWREPDRYGLRDLAPLEEWNFHEAPICETRHLNKSQLTAAAIRMHLDRGGDEPLDPAVHALVTRRKTWGDEEPPEEAAYALARLGRNVTIASLLRDVTRKYSARGRLIALYWLSSLLREGALRVVRVPSQRPHDRGTATATATRFQSARRI